MPKKGVKHVSITRQQKIDLKKKSIADPNMTHEELNLVSIITVKVLFY